MRRLWFKADMKDAILEGRKNRTTRTHPLKVGEDYQAVSGSRFKAQPFAILQIVSMFQTTAHALIHNNFEQEGFESPQQMTDWLMKAKLLDKWVQSDGLYTHRFEIKQHIAAPPKANGKARE